MNEAQKKTVAKIQKKLKSGKSIAVGWSNDGTFETISFNISKKDVKETNTHVKGNPYSWLLDLSVDDGLKRKKYEEVQEIVGSVEFFENEKNGDNYVKVYEGDNAIGLYDPIDHIPDDYDEMSDNEQDEWELSDATRAIKQDVEDDAYNNQDDLDKLLKIALEYLE